MRGFYAAEPRGVSSARVFAPRRGDRREDQGQKWGTNIGAAKDVRVERGRAHDTRELPKKRRLSRGAQLGEDTEDDGAQQLRPLYAVLLARVHRGMHK